MKKKKRHKKTTESAVGRAAPLGDGAQDVESPLLGLPDGALRPLGAGHRVVVGHLHAKQRREQAHPLRKQLGLLHRHGQRVAARGRGPNRIAEWGVSRPKIGRGGGGAILKIKYFNIK